MPLSYYIKNRVIDYVIDYDYDEDLRLDKNKIKELLDNIYNCCINGNIGKDERHYKKIHKKNVNVKYPITTDIKFRDINYKYSDNTEEIEKKILAIYDKTNNLTPNFFLRSYFNEVCNALIAFDEDDNIYTILTYIYNVEEDCIEVHALWSNIRGGGGGIMMNFLINAIKCGISLCSNPANYKRKIILHSVNHEDTIDFYEKFDFIDDNNLFFTRQLSVGSLDLNGEREILEDLDLDKLDQEKKKLYRNFERNNKNINNLNNKLQYLENDLKYLSNITTRGEIDKTKNEIENLRGQQINVMDKLIQVLNKIIEIERIEIEYKAQLYNILSLLTHENTRIEIEYKAQRYNIFLTDDDIRDDTLDDYTKNFLDKIIDKKKTLDLDKLDELIIKETSENNDFFKFVIQYLNNNGYNGKDMERFVLPGVYYEIDEEKDKVNSELKLVKKLIEMKENSGGRIHKKQRKTRRKSNKKNKLKRKINKSKKHY
jgi:hypothetical protein